MMRGVRGGWLAVVLTAATCCVAHAVPIAGVAPAATVDQAACNTSKDRLTAIQACTGLISLSSADPAAASDAAALKLDPKSVRALQLRALIYMLRGNTDGAMADLDQAIDIAPGDE